MRDTSALEFRNVTRHVARRFRCRQADVRIGRGGQELRDVAVQSSMPPSVRSPGRRLSLIAKSEMACRASPPIESSTVRCIRTMRFALSLPFDSEATDSGCPTAAVAYHRRTTTTRWVLRRESISPRPAQRSTLLAVSEVRRIGGTNSGRCCSRDAPARGSG